MDIIRHLIQVKKMEWNKINVETQNILFQDNSPLYLNIDNNTKLEITVNENVSTKLVIVGTSDYSLNIKLNKRSSLIGNSLNKDNNVNVLVNLCEESNINYNHSTLANNDSNNTFTINHLGNSSVSDLNNSGINRNDKKLFFNIDGVIPKDLKEIVCNQSSKIINFNNGNSKIIPNLIIDSNDIIANHAAYIGELGEEELFYMQSRGINKEDIKKLVYKATLLGKMPLEEEKEEFNKIINEWW